MANDLVMRYQFASYMGCKKYTGAGVYAVTIGGTLANGDKIVVCGVETVLDATSSASGTAAAAAVKANLDNATSVTTKYTLANSSSNIITFTEKSGYYGVGKPTARITSSAGTIGVSTTTAPTTGDEFNLIGEGFTSFPEAKNPQEYSRKYINYKTEKTDVIGYSPSIEYSADVISDDPVVQEIVRITDKELVGTDTHRVVISVNLWEETGTANEYKAYKRTYAIVPNQKGEGTDALIYTGTFRAVSDIVEGVFNTSSKTFTET